MEILAPWIPLMVVSLVVASIVDSVLMVAGLAWLARRRREKR